MTCVPPFVLISSPCHLTTGCYTAFCITGLTSPNSCTILLLSSLLSKGSYESIVGDTSTLATTMLKGNKLNRGSWKPNTFFDKWSWAEATTKPEAQRSRPEQEPRRPAQGIYWYFLSYNWKPWNTPWFVFFYKDWWALCFSCLVWTVGLHLYHTFKKKSKIENMIKKNIFVGRKCY